MLAESRHLKRRADRAFFQRGTKLGSAMGLGTAVGQQGWARWRRSERQGAEAGANRLLLTLVSASR